MKKLLFVCYGLGIGGIEKCLVNLVNQLDPDIYDITVATMNPEYTFLPDIAKHVKIIKFEDNFMNTTDTIEQIRKSTSVLRKVKMLCRYIIYRFAVKLGLKSWKVQRPINEEYDIAIAYSHTGNVPNYVIDKTNAKTKILWYHTLWGEAKNYLYYGKFNRIVAVSKYAHNNFIKMYPLLENKTTVLYNLYDIKKIVFNACQKADGIEEEKVSILTVARLSNEKGYELAIMACNVLRAITDTKFKWYWVGDGPERQLANKMIQELNLSDIFILLGDRTNPYPYINGCDVYVQPSIREAFCTTIIEAKILKKPIVTTNIGSSHEQIKNNVDGLIAEMNSESIANKVKLLLENDLLRKSIAKNSYIDNKYNEKQLVAYNELFLD